MNAFVLSRARTLQWLAALVAVGYHVRSLLFVNFGGAVHMGLVARAFYFVSSLGHEAFLVYLSVAGLLFGAQAWPQWRDDGAAAMGGLAAHLRVLYGWLVPALLVGGLLDVAGSHWFHASGVYAITPQFHPAHLSLKTLAGNLVLLQDVAVQGYGSNAMLFLLTYEWWACAAAAMYALAGPARRGRAFAGACAVGFGIGVVAPEFFGYWLAWLAGWAAARLGPLLRGRLGTWPGAILFAAALLGSRLEGARLAAFPPAYVVPARLALDLVVVLGAGAWLLALQSATPRPTRAALHRWLAALCPPVYAIHFPLMLFIVAGAAQLLGLRLHAQPGPGPACAFVLVCGAILLFTVGFARAVRAARWWLARPAARLASPVAGRTSAAPKVK